jgi:hypothetical protein
MTQEQGYRKRVNNGWLIWLKHNIYMSEIPRQPPSLNYQYTLQSEGQEGKTGPVCRWIAVGGLRS